jgi:hypothetical protein
MSALIRHVGLVSESKSIDMGQVAVVAAALQKQVTRDFGPMWQITGTVDAFETLETVPVDYWPVVIRDNINQPGAAGFHQDDQGRPFALVQANSDWSLTASHETLEMLADPTGMTTIAGAPPAQAEKPLSGFERVLYLEEVCDPCESDDCTYLVNGVKVSDFITPHYYDPQGTTGARYSFTGKIEAPHTVLEGGYVSFGNPVDNHWYQIFVEDGKNQARDLGLLKTTKGKSLRELVDREVRKKKKSSYYRIKSPSAKGPSKISTLAATPHARAKSLRSLIEALK